MFSNKRLEDLEYKHEQDFCLMQSEIANLEMTINYKVESDRVKKLEERISDLEIEDTHISKRFSKLEERISDLEKENRELQVFKDFVEQFIRDFSDAVVDIDMPFEQIRKVCGQAAELTDEPYQSPCEEESENDAED